MNDTGGAAKVSCVLSARGLRKHFRQGDVTLEVLKGVNLEIGRGEQLWSSHEELLDRFHLDSVPSPSGVTHLLFWRR